MDRPKVVQVREQKGGIAAGVLVPAVAHAVGDLYEGRGEGEDRPRERVRDVPWLMS